MSAGERLSLPSEPRIPERRNAPWEALRYRDYRLLWLGMLVSSIGFWMQFTSITYFLGVDLAHSPAQSAFNLGLLGAARSIPILIFGPIAGFVADTYPRRMTLFITNTVSAAAAIAISLVSQFRGDWVLPVTLGICSVFGIAQSFDNPARNSWIAFIVPRALLSNAIGLYSVAGNIPLMVGPALAGIVIASIGVHASFLVQAATQWAVVISVAMMSNPGPQAGSKSSSMFAQIAEGVRFVATHDVLRWVGAILLLTCLFVRPYTWLLASFAHNVLHVDARGYGLMLAMGGLGTLFGGLTTAIAPSERRGRQWFTSGTIVAIGMVALSMTRSFSVVLPLLFFMGWATMSFVTSTQVIAQIFAHENMRGRAMSLYSISMNGFVPMGTLIMGTIGSFAGLPLTYALGGTIAIVAGVSIWIGHPALRRA